MADEKNPIPPPKPDDPEDVSWALSTAETTWGRGDRADALKWLRRAAEAASEAEADDRALELAKRAAELASELESTKRGASVPPPPVRPPPALFGPPQPAPRPRTSAPPPVPHPQLSPVPPAASPTASPAAAVGPTSLTMSEPPPTVVPTESRVPPPPAVPRTAPAAPPVPAAKGSEPRRAPPAPTRPAAPALPPPSPGSKPSALGKPQSPKSGVPSRPPPKPEQASALPAPPARSKPPPPNTARDLEKAARAARAAEEPTVTMTVPQSNATRGDSTIPHTPRAGRIENGGRATKPVTAHDIDSWPTASLQGDDPFVADENKTRIDAPAYREPEYDGSHAVPPRQREVRPTQAVRVVVWRAGDGVHVAPHGTTVSAISVDAMLVALDPTADLFAWLKND